MRWPVALLLFAARAPAPAREPVREPIPASPLGSDRAEPRLSIDERGMPAMSYWFCSEGCEESGNACVPVLAAFR